MGEHQQRKSICEKEDSRARTSYVFRKIVSLSVSVDLIPETVA